MRPYDEYLKVLDLVTQGLNDCEIARATGIPRCTVRDWRRGRNVKLRDTSWRDASKDLASLPRGSYAYLFGLYLGDGHISLTARTWRLRVALDLGWPRIILMCAAAMEAVFPKNRVSIFWPERGSDCTNVSVHSNRLPSLFPQHGAGPKHLRSIELADWQRELVEEETRPFLRGLIHSDGCRFMNRVRIKGKTYEYPRYNFTNASDDIRKLFTDACDHIGVEWRQMNARNISVARRDSVARLDEFIGPKQTEGKWQWPSPATLRNDLQQGVGQSPWRGQDARGQRDAALFL